MLIFRLSRVMALRGVSVPYSFLKQNGFHRTVARNLSHDRVENIKIAHLEKLCRLLNCTPNDLFEWKSDDNAANALNENHVLQSLKRNQTAQSLRKVMKDIPVDKLERIEEVLNQLKDERN